jgi:hypothetical protein
MDEAGESCTIRERTLSMLTVILITLLVVAARGY